MPDKCISAAARYGWTEWLAESPILRAKMVAHEMIKGMRDSYNVEVRQAMIERGEMPAKAPPLWQSIREKFFRPDYYPMITRL